MKKVDIFEKFHAGEETKGHKLFGAHLTKKSYKFTLWAPNATKVSVIGDFNDWDNTIDLMKKNEDGIWSLNIKNVKQNQHYMYEITDYNENVKRKADPYAQWASVRPERASIVYDNKGFTWHDKKWLNKRKKQLYYKMPIAIYELHLGSWKRDKENEFLNYKALANELIPYVLEQGFTHIELMPITEYPYDGSWGYQATGYFSPTSRYGTPDELKIFINECHIAGLGVIMDFVPGHFCKDDHGLFLLDGTPTYEYENVSVQSNDGWGTANFYLSKNQVQSYLISSAMYWLEEFHIDGFRIDAVANLIYWNLDGKNQENPHAIRFLKKFNGVIKKKYPDVLLFAEDSTTFEGVTLPVENGGLGFDFKWKMGWMNDILSYMQLPTSERVHHHDKLTFGMWYAHTEKFILPFSHDEVVHLKKSLLNKMAGDEWQKFAQLRLLYGFMFTHPGKKLLFMGSEFAQTAEWDENIQLGWHHFDDDRHLKVNLFTKHLLKIYRESKPLYECDHEESGFSWIDANNNEQSILSYIRYDQLKNPLVIVCNFTEHVYYDYKVGVPNAISYEEIFNSDKDLYGGSNLYNGGIIKLEDEPFHNQPSHVEMTIAPMAISILKPTSIKLKS